MGWPLINHIIAVTTKFPIEDLTPEYYAIIALARSLYLMVSIVVLISIFRRYSKDFFKE